LLGTAIVIFETYQAASLHLTKFEVKPENCVLLAINTSETSDTSPDWAFGDKLTRAPNFPSQGHVETRAP